MKQLLKRAIHTVRAWNAPRPKVQEAAGIKIGPLSMSWHEDYEQVCLDASSECRAFNGFRKHPEYTEVLEHVSEAQGRQYLDILSRDPQVLGAMERIKQNDKYGNPKTHDFPGVGTVSATTLRYAKVLADLKSWFKTLDGMRICEIGVGYGGQCRVINALFRPAAYCLVDIRPALLLAQRYLDNYIIPAQLSFKTMNELGRESFDLVISNYAFTELSRPIQDVYLQKIILNSRRGYVTCNDHTPDEYESYKAHELLSLLQGAKIVKEEPLTAPKNCIIVWGAAN